MPTLSRSLTYTDAVFIGLAAMLGAGVFAVLSPAVAAAGSLVWVSLLVAALIAYCNAVSSAQLAAHHPQAGGTYLYARERLHPAAGFVAGACFVTGKSASGAAMALTFAHYALPGYEKPIALLTLAILTLANLMGIKKTAGVSRVIVVIVVATLLLLAGVCLSSANADPGRLLPRGDSSLAGVVQGAALWFFAFAGYARLATLAEEVQNPKRVLTRAIPLALFIVLGLYILTSIAALSVLTPGQLASTTTPLYAAAQASGHAWLAPAVRAVAALACLGVLIALIAGISRTLLAMSRERDMPAFLNAIHAKTQVPHRAELVVALAIGIGITLLELDKAIGFSAFCVLLYYALANASALKLTADERVWARAWSYLGLAGCILLAFSLPLVSVVAGGAVVAALTLCYLLASAR